MCDHTVRKAVVDAKNVQKVKINTDRFVHLAYCQWSFTFPYYVSNNDQFTPMYTVCCPSFLPLPSSGTVFLIAYFVFCFFTVFYTYRITDVSTFTKYAIVPKLCKSWSLSKTSSSQTLSVCRSKQLSLLVPVFC